MDYSIFSLEELERKLDVVVEAYKNGDMSHTDFADKFDRLFALIALKKDQKEAPEVAYARAMRGIC